MRDLFGFRPCSLFRADQDKQYLAAFAQLPDAASLDRTEDVIAGCRRLRSQPGVADAIAFPVCRSTDSPSARTLECLRRIVPARRAACPKLSGPAIADALNQQLGHQEASSPSPAAAMNGLGTIDGFKLHRRTALVSDMKRSTPHPDSSAGRRAGFTRVFTATNHVLTDADVDRQAKLTGSVGVFHYADHLGCFT
jgi:multidrug efflux pump